jgi:hypothetical protein
MAQEAVNAGKNEAAEERAEVARTRREDILFKKWQREEMEKQNRKSGAVERELVKHGADAGLGLAGVSGMALHTGEGQTDVTLGRGRRLTQWRVALPEAAAAVKVRSKELSNDKNVSVVGTTCTDGTVLLDGWQERQLRGEREWRAKFDQLRLDEGMQNLPHPPQPHREKDGGGGNETASVHTFKQQQPKKDRAVNITARKGQRERPIMALLPVGKAVDAAVRKMMGMLEHAPPDHYAPPRDAGHATAGKDDGKARRESLSKLEYLLNSGSVVGLPDFNRATLEKLLQEHMLHENSIGGSGNTHKQPHRPSHGNSSASNAPRKFRPESHKHPPSVPETELASQLHSLLTSKLQQQTFNTNVARFKLNPQPPARTDGGGRRTSTSSTGHSTGSAGTGRKGLPTSQTPVRMSGLGGSKAASGIGGTADKGRRGGGKGGGVRNRVLSATIDSPTTITTAAAARVAMARTMASVGMASVGTGTVYDAIATARKLAASTVAAEPLPFDKAVPWWRDDEVVGGVDGDPVLNPPRDLPPFNHAHNAAPDAASWRLKAMASPLLLPKDDRLGLVPPKWSLHEGQHAIAQVPGHL